MSVVLMLSTGCDPKPSGRSTESPAGVPAQPSLVPTANMIPIKAGMFTRIKFPVTLTRDFWLGKYEVTQGEFTSLMGKNPSHFTGDSNRPVEKVTLLDANAYCATLTQRERAAGRLPRGYEYRLPTEAEWEYACLAGSTNRFGFAGEDVATGDKYAWTAENSDATTHPIGSKLPNSWGLYDMHGNVWEWCSDWFEPYPPKPLMDPEGPASGKYKVFKGGGWNQDLEFARSANRFMMSPSNGIHFVGFRVALSAVKPAPPRPNPLLP